ncbi:MAG: hypothetical protein ABJN62_03935 [Halioglobus sp.]
MYRYSLDNAVTYTSEDFVLFRESPFACWMERLSLENPDHGILPDRHTTPPTSYMQRQDELAETLRAEDKNVNLIDWESPEAERRAATLQGMRQGVDFIVNGQLALGPLSSSANLLMRTSGFSELGNYLYIPCDTQAKTTLNSAFRLCFLADLLHSLQGQLPPQMLIIRGGSDLIPLETEDHIYHYRAVKQRFMQTMREFRKHRMPDPAESAQFGRWSDCANEVLKQRALRDENAPEDTSKDDIQEQEQSLPLPMVATASAQAAEPTELKSPDSSVSSKHSAKGIQVGDTLAVQARQLPPRAFSDNSGDIASAVPAAAASVMDVALQNLEFIGSSRKPPSIGEPVDTPRRKPQEPVAEPEASPDIEAEPERIAQAPSESPEMQRDRVADRLEPQPPAESTANPLCESVTERFAGPVGEPFVEPAQSYSEPAAQAMLSHPLDSTGIFAENPSSAAAADAQKSPPSLHTDGHEFEIDCVDDSDYALPEEPPEFSATPHTERRLETREHSEDLEELDVTTTRPFSSSLNTSDYQDS